jgi:hypothetical protein
MALLTALSLTRAGINPDPATAAAAGGDEADNPAGDLAFSVKNASASAITVTLNIRAPGPDGAPVTNPTVSVPAGSTRMVGPFPTGVYNDANGRARITYSAVTSVTVLAVRLNP